MAEWRTVTREKNGCTSSFSVIGKPFSFLWASPHGDPVAYLRCFPTAAEEEQDVLLFQKFLGTNDIGGVYYDLAFKSAGEDDDVFEDGWYLSGVGHHLLWCGAVLEEAVDAAQEHIAWDGSNPEKLPAVIRFTAEGTLSHKLPYPDPSVWEDESLWFGLWTGKTEKRTDEQPKG